MLPNFAQLSRPRRLSDLAGQPVAQAMLGPQLEARQVGPVLLMAGPRGTGKTTSARIVSTALNCEVSPGLEPCGGCRSCQAMARLAPSTETYLELDAGTSGTIDQIRQLVAEASMPVAPGQTRVIVLDECHLLSQAAASALLKTLEEPPPRVVFVLATTDPHKLLPTIRSRCLEIPFTEVPAAAVEARLAELAAEHSLELSGEQVQAIAVAAGGDLRRAMKLLQTSGTPDAFQSGTFLLDTAGGSRELLAARLVLAVAEGDLPKAAAEGRLLFGGQGSRRLSLQQAFSLLGEQLYRLNLLLAGVPAAELQVSAPEAQALAEASQLLTPGRGLAWAEALTSSWSALADAPLADEPALGLVLLRMLRANDQPAAPAPSASPGLPTTPPAPAGPIATPTDAAGWAQAITGLEPGLAALLGKAQLVSLANGLAVLRASSITRQRLQPRLMEAATALGLAIELAA